MPGWSLSGMLFEACNCEAACPCLFLSRPTEGDCTALVGWHVETGRDGEVPLDGLNVALAVHAPGYMPNGNWKVAVYVDERATGAQRESLLRIFGGQAGGHPAVLAGFIGEILGVKAVPIDFTSEGRSHKLTIGEVGSAEIEHIVGQQDGDVTITGHPLAVGPGFPVTAAKSKQLRYSDHGISWSLSEKNGIFSRFAYQG